MALSAALQRIRRKWSTASQRTRLAFKNIVFSLILKAASIVTSLMVVPMTIHYIDDVQYGIWLAISSIISWVNFFDLGLANGFKNRFAEAKAKNDLKLAREYVSTTYAIISIIIGTLFCIIVALNAFVDWASVLNVSQQYELVLRKVFLILSTIICLNMVIQIFAKLVEADQRPSIASAIACVGQLLSLLSIYLLTKFTSGSLIKLALYFSSVPMLTMLLASIIFFGFTRYKAFRPSFSTVRFRLVKNIIGLGFKFFMIYLCLIAIFQIMNIILSRVCGPIAVTEYNVCYKYFSVAYMVAVIVVSPMWAAFTDAYTQKDFAWMRSMLRKLELGILIGIATCVVALALSPWAFKLWLGDSVTVHFALSVGVMVYVIAQIAGAVYMNFINGCGTVRIQFLIYLIFALVSFPVMTLCCRMFGTIGIIIVPSVVYLTQAIMGRIQINKIINQTATGIWIK